MAGDLGHLDLGIPIGALDQPHHQATVGSPRQIDQPIDQQMSFWVNKLMRYDAPPNKSCITSSNLNLFCKKMNIASRYNWQDSSISERSLMWFVILP
jgi:hypothetical protein